MTNQQLLTQLAEPGTYLIYLGVGKTEVFYLYRNTTGFSSVSGQLALVQLAGLEAQSYIRAEVLPGSIILMYHLTDKGRELVGSWAS